MNRDRTSLDAQIAASRVIGGVFGFAFAGIGLTLLGFLWGTPFNQFGAPPLVFRVFGSFIALVFVVAGGTTFFAAIAGGQVLGRSLPLDKLNQLGIGDKSPDPSNSPLNYSCSNCGAQLAKQSDVSPLGDVKCSFCHQWFNIHRPPERI